jgi:hypothetical protein
MMRSLLDGSTTDADTDAPDASTAKLLLAAACSQR